MVALSPRFAVLAAFISLASFSTSPLSVGAAVIPRAQENANTARFFDSSRLQSAFRLSQAKAVKRYDDCYKDDCPQFCSYLSARIILKRAQVSPHWSLRKHGKSYTVSHSSKHSQSYGHPRHSRDIVVRQEAQPKNGKIAIVTPDGKILGYLEVKKNNQDPQPTSLPVEGTEKNPTTFALVKELSSAPQAGAEGLQVVTFQVPPPDQSQVRSADQSQPNMWCMSYNATQPENSNLFASPCDKSGRSGISQGFAYNETSQDVSPLSYKPQTDSAQSVLSRDDGQDKNGEGQAKVFLRFVPQPDEPQSEKAEDVADASDGGSPIATTTKTVTVTNTPSASVSAADTSATPSANASSSASTSPTSTANGATPSADASSSASMSSASTANGATPSANASSSASMSSTPTTNGAAPTAGAPGTAGAAGVLDVEVVQASSTSSTVASASASSVSAAPTTTMNPQDIASSIANSAATSSPTASGTSAAASTSTGTGSSTSAGSPSARAVRRGPYKWL